MGKENIRTLNPELKPKTIAGKFLNYSLVPFLTLALVQVSLAFVYKYKSEPPACNTSSSMEPGNEVLEK